MQRSYVEFWADVIVRAGRLERREEATAAAHAIFGLLNSTPFSGPLDDQRLRALLNSMALGGLGAAPGPSRPPVDAGQAGRASQAKRTVGSPTQGGQFVNLVHHGAVAELVLDRPEAERALSLMFVQLAAACAQLSQRRSPSRGDLFER